jgi:hypothetical protein
MIWIADAYRDDENHFVVHADEKLTAFLQPESATQGYPRSCESLRIVALQGERPVLRDCCIEIGAHGIHPLESHL